MSNGETIKYILMSGVCGELGEGWYWILQLILKILGLYAPDEATGTAKTTTAEYRKGNWQWRNPLHCVRPIFRKYFLGICGTVNSVGLSNGGFEALCEKLEKLEPGRKLIISLSGTPQELAAMAKDLARFSSKIIAVEINVSCPNTECRLDDANLIINSCKGVFEALKSGAEITGQTKIPVILKVSYAQYDIIETILEGVKDLIEAITINSVPWNKLFMITDSPLYGLNKDTGGGASGEIAQKLNWQLIERILSLPGINIPVIGCDVWHYSDIEKLLSMGCRAIGFGAINLIKPWAPAIWIRRHKTQHKQAATA